MTRSCRAARAHGKVVRDDDASLVVPSTGRGHVDTVEDDGDHAR
jgi:hypothetical protein